MWILMVFLTVYGGGASISQTTFRIQDKCVEAQQQVERVQTQILSSIRATCIYVDAAP